ncbi:MAG: hypothetical protein ACRD6X_13275 [Pyrinomonadaceae bacterium]
MESPVIEANWQVDVGGTIYEASFNELGQWIDEGALLPEDKVRKGNLRWIEARKVPGLFPFFNAKANGDQMTVVVSQTDSSPELSVPETQAFVPQEFSTNSEVSSAVTENFIRPASSAQPNTAFCAIHPKIESSFLCQTCSKGFCRSCPKSYGGTVNICPLCGAMCRAVGEVKAAQFQAFVNLNAIQKGFGIADFFSALRHPFNFKLSLFFGAILFMLFTLGKGAAWMGGIYLIVGGIFSGMSANALTFGVLSNTIDKFIQGKFDANFMPEFENFDLWDDVIHPYFLSIAAYLSSFGPFLIVLAIGFYLITSEINGKAEAYKSDLEKIPGTQIYAGRELADQSGDVKEVLKNIDQKQRDRIAAATTTEEAENEAESAFNAAPTPFIDEESRQQEELWATATQSRKTSLESAIGNSPETQAEEQEQMLAAFLNLAAPLVVIGFITFIWGLIYFPAACAVAGYSKSFSATINPLVGLDTMKRLGVTYIKILSMGFFLLAASLLVGLVLGAIFAPFNLPGVGNLPANGLGAIFSFYLMAVFACILGYALFKNADKLDLVS